LISCRSWEAELVWPPARSESASSSSSGFPWWYSVLTQFFCTTFSLNVMIRTSSLSRLLILAFFYLLTVGIFTTNGTLKKIIIIFVCICPHVSSIVVITVVAVVVYSAAAAVVNCWLLVADLTRRAYSVIVKQLNHGVYHKLLRSQFFVLLVCFLPYSQMVLICYILFA